MFLIAKRIGFAVSKKKNFSHSVQSAITHSRSFRGYHNASLLPSPQISLTIAPFLGASGGDQSSSLPVGVGSAWGPAPGPYLILWPFLVSWSIPPMSQVGLSCLESQNTSLKEDLEYRQMARLLIHLRVPSLQHGRATSLVAQRAGMVGILLRTSRNVAETSNREIKHHTQRVREPRFITPSGPEELTLKALSPEQRDYRVFYT